MSFIQAMQKNDSISRISAQILAFQAWERPWEFRHFVLNQLKEENDAIRFEAIWAITMKLENWNHEDLNICAQKTAEMLQNKLGLTETVASQLANAAASQWK